MTGPIVLNADPTSSLQAATKNYVDTHAGAPSNPVSGASAEYPMVDGSGTTVADVSGIRYALHDSALVTFDRF